MAYNEGLWILNPEHLLIDFFFSFVFWLEACKTFSFERDASPMLGMVLGGCGTANCRLLVGEASVLGQDTSRSFTHRKDSLSHWLIESPRCEMW